MKKLANLKSVKTLSKKQQKGVNGGRAQCMMGGVCVDFGPQCAEIECVFGEIGGGGGC